MVPGLIWGVTGILLFGVSRALFTIGSEAYASNSQDRLNAYHGFIVMALILGSVFSISSAIALEKPQFVYGLSLSTAMVMFVNIVAIISTTFTGTSILVYSPISFAEQEPRLSNAYISTSNCWVSLISGLFVLLAATYSSPASIVSWIQLASFLTAAIFLNDFAQIYSNMLKVTDLTHQPLSAGDPSFGEPRKANRGITFVVLFLLIIFSSGCISTLSNISINSIPPAQQTSLDYNYTAKSRFDIVVSMYDESPESVKHMLDSLKRTTMLSSLSPNIIIYTKDPNADIKALKEATGANTIERLKNLGREGGTYLHHIASNWDSLAEQTMFIQAHAHNMRELIPRINSYLVSDTGMLSLGFTGVSCSCNSCEDRWGWSDSFSLVPSLYSKIYGKACDADTPLLLSYKGQFVASGRRIRGIDKKVWVDLLDAITSKEGWSHDKHAVGGKTDTPDNPFLGFTVERVWGLLMQCATDGVVATKCPSLLSGMSRNGEVEDCQCLDMEKVRA